MSTGEVIGALAFSVTVLGIAFRFIYKQGRSDRDTESVMDWKLEVIRRLETMTTTQSQTVTQLSVMANTLAMVVDRVEGLEDRERERGTR